MSAVILVGFASTLRSKAVDPAYTITDLGTFSGPPNQSHGYGINNCGTTVGDSLPAGPFSHPFYKKGATMTDVGTLGSGDGAGYSVNSFGYMVGYSTSSTGQRAILWHDNDDDGVSDPGELQDFLPAGAIGVAYEINDSNVVVGLVDTSGGSSLSDSPFKWDATNGLQILSGNASISPTRAQGINNAGTIAGWATVSLPPFAPVHAFVLKNNSTYIDLGTLDNTSSALMSFSWRISEDGHVVGYSQTPSNNASKPIHPFVWFDANSNNTADAGEMIDLHTLSGTNAYGYDINATGYVVGTSEVTAGGTHAYVWHDDDGNGVDTPGEMKDLNGQFSDATWTTLVEARSINDGGQIVGWGTKSNGETHAFLLTPTGFSPPACPTPSASPSPSPSPTPATTSLTNVSGSGTYGGTATLSATLMAGATPVSGKTISFTVNAGSVCGGVSQPACPTTDASGVATLSGVSLAGINAGSYPNAVGASFAGDSSYASSSGTGTLTVNKATPTISWNNPADIVYGALLSSTQLNATASVPGVLTYTPTTGTKLNAGNGQTLHVDFTPTDTTNYNNASTNVLINVSKATPTINWSNPADITYGTLLSVTQFNATATNPVDSSSVAGTFTYSPVAGTKLNAGNGQTLHVDFTPTDTTNYNNASKNVLINVSKATPVITWNNPADITYGTLLSGTQLNATATNPIDSSSVAGTFTYSPVAGTKLNAGNGQTLHVDLTPTDTTNYNNASKNVLINVSKATPVITWNNPADITYGTLLSGTQLNASATNPIDSSSLTGTFTYTPAAGTALHAGNAQTLRAAFAPSDTTNYNTPAQKTVSINVLKVGLTITADNKVKLLGDPNPTLTFTPSGFVNGDTSSVLTGTPTITTTATQGSPVGNYPITITQGTLAAADYSFTFVNGTLNIVEPAPVVLLETGTNNAAALDSVTFVRGPFRVTDPFNFSSDHITRIILFTAPLASPDSTLKVFASGHQLQIESFGTVTGVPGLSASYIVFKLDPTLTGSGPINHDLTVSLRNVTSNTATLTIIP